MAKTLEETKAEAGNPDLTANASIAQRLMVMTSTALSRAQIASKLGTSFGGDRNLYDALGYKKTLSFDDYYAFYLRQGLGYRIIKAPVDATWRGIPELKASDALVNAWKDLVEKKKVLHYLTRADRLSRIGQFAVLFMGFKDGESDLAKEVSAGQGKELLYLSPYMESNVTIDSENMETDASNERFGLPKFYTLQMTDDKDSGGRKVHWTRVIHLAENLDEDEIYGTPALRCVYNNLMDVDKVAGGSGEMFWRGAFPGYNFEIDPEADTTKQSLTRMQNEIEDYFHKLSRYLRLQGVNVKELPVQVANPRQHLTAQLELISGGTGTPIRILIGSERGQLASSEDRRNWHDRITERRLDYAEPFVLRPFLDRCMWAGVLPTESYKISWPNLQSLNDIELAEVGLNKTKSIQTYVTSGGDAILPPLDFLIDILGYDEEKAEKLVESIVAMLKQEEAEAQAAVDTEDEEEDGVRPNTISTSVIDYKAVHGHAKIKAGNIGWYFHNFATHGDNVGYQHCVGGAANPYEVKHIGTNYNHAISKQYARGHGHNSVPQWFKFTKKAGEGRWYLSSFEEIDVADVPAGFK